MAITKYQKFETKVVNRKDIKKAEYNPRIITDEAKKALKKNINKHGLVQTLVWNQRTGNLVGGHQRLEILDTLEGKDDYDLELSVIDVDEEEEKVLNVQLNNPSMMGDWDLDKLGELNLELDFKDMGFNESDMAFLLGTDEEFNLLFGDTEEVQEAKADLKDIKKDRAEQTEKMKKENSVSFYFTVVCASENEKKELLKGMGIQPYETFVDSSALNRLLKRD